MSWLSHLNLISDNYILFGLRRLLRTGHINHQNGDLQTEEDIVRSMGYSYIVSYQTKHFLPRDDQVELFLEAMKKIPIHS